MLASFELHLRPRTAIPLDRHVGRWINGLFYDLVGQGDPALASRIHSGSGIRPFTCSVLHGPRRRIEGRPAAVPSETYRVRFTTLTRELHEALGPVVLRHYVERGEVDVGPARAQLVDVSVAPHAAGPWIGVTSYEALLQDSGSALTIPIDFASPTAFKRGTEHLLFPLPNLVFGSLLRTWRTFAPPEAQISLDETFADRVRVSRYSLRTDAIEAGRYKLIGFTGHCAFRAPNDELVLTHALNTLAAAARYLGVARRRRRAWARHGAAYHEPCTPSSANHGLDRASQTPYDAARRRLMAIEQLLRMQSGTDSALDPPFSPPIDMTRAGLSHATVRQRSTVIEHDPPGASKLLSQHLESLVRD